MTEFMYTVQKTNNLLMDIINSTKDEELADQCRNTIFMLTKKFKVLGRCPQCDSFTKQNKGSVA